MQRTSSKAVHITKLRAWTVPRAQLEEGTLTEASHIVGLLHAHLSLVSQGERPLFWFFFDLKLGACGLAAVGGQTKLQIGCGQIA